MGKVSEEDMLEYSSRHLTLIVPLYMHTILTELSGFLQINICNEVCLCMCDQKFFFSFNSLGKERAGLCGANSGLAFEHQQIPYCLCCKEAAAGISGRVFTRL